MALKAGTGETAVSAESDTVAVGMSECLAFEEKRLVSFDAGFFITTALLLKETEALRAAEGRTGRFVARPLTVTGVATRRAMVPRFGPADSAEMMSLAAP